MLNRNCTFSSRFFQEKYKLTKVAKMCMISNCFSKELALVLHKKLQKYSFASISLTVHKQSQVLVRVLSRMT